MNLIGRLVSQPEVRESRNGKEYLRYVIATNDPLGPPQENGTPAEPTSSFHSIFAFGESTVNRLRELQKGTLMYVEADFRVARTPGEGDMPPQDQILSQHSAYCARATLTAGSYKVILRPKQDV